MKKEIWKETFTEAMSLLEDDTIRRMEDVVAEQKNAERAGDRKATRKKAPVGIWKKAVSWVAAAAILLLGIFGATQIFPHTLGIPTGEGISAIWTPGGQGAAVVLARAEYPEQAKVTGKFDSIGMEAHTKARAARLSLAKTYAGDLSGFYRECLTTLVAEAPEENVIAAPANLFLSLSMLAECAGGQTRQQILDVLGKENIQTLRELSHSFWLANYRDDGTATSHLANSVWLNRGFSVNPEVLDTLKNLYYASAFEGEMGSETYDEMLRRWLNEETGNLLAESVKNLGFENTELLSLISTIYYEGKWTTAFDPARTTAGVFHGTKGDSEALFLHSNNSESCYFGESFTALALPLGDGDTMWLLLPDEGTDAKSLAADEEALSLLTAAGDWAALHEKWKGKRTYSTVHLALPKYDLTMEKDLADALKSLGITDAFSPENADFTGFVDTEQNVYVSKVQNNLRVTVDEEGVSAASLIKVALDGAAMPEGDVYMTLDRPFLYGITSDTGALLFAGVVEQMGE